MRTGSANIDADDRRPGRAVTLMSTSRELNSLVSTLAFQTTSNTPRLQIIVVCATSRQAQCSNVQPGLRPTSPAENEAFVEQRRFGLEGPVSEQIGLPEDISHLPFVVTS